MHDLISIIWFLGILCARIRVPFYLWIVIVVITGGIALFSLLGRDGGSYSSSSTGGGGGSSYGCAILLVIALVLLFALAMFS